MMLYQTLAPTPGRVLGLVRLLGGLADKSATRRELCDLMDPPTLRPRPVAEPKDIGEILGSSPATAKKHLERVYVKLGVETRTAAAGVAIKRIRELQPQFEL